MPITKLHILQLLRAAPDGLTSDEIAAALGVNPHQLSGRLSKLTAYGELDKYRNPASSGKAVWRFTKNEKSS
jgi:predicted ArsR family transcriptional regulator